MPSWRATASHEVQEDLDAIIARALNTTVGQLTPGTPLTPFAVVLGLGGMMELATAQPQPGEDAPQVLARLRTGLSGRASELRAVAFVSTAQEDAVLVEAEHRDGGPGLQVRVPFRWRGWPRRRAVLDAMVAEPVARWIW